AVLAAFAIAVPAVFAMLHSRRARPVLYAAIVWPLLAPPCVIAYAWNLLATQKTWLAALLTHALGWHTQAMAPIVAAWLQATWLWPVPALALLAGYRLRGAAAFR